MEVILTLADWQWDLIEPALPGRPGKPGRNGNDNRMALEGMIWICRTGAPWRDLPEMFGKWNTVYRRFRRWVAAGVFDHIFDEIGDGLNMQTAMQGRKAGTRFDHALVVAEKTTPNHSQAMPLQTPPV